MTNIILHYVYNTIFIIMIQLPSISVVAIISLNINELVKEILRKCFCLVIFIDLQFQGQFWKTEIIDLWHQILQNYFYAESGILRVKIKYFVERSDSCFVGKWFSIHWKCLHCKIVSDHFLKHNKKKQPVALEWFFVKRLDLPKT